MGRAGGSWWRGGVLYHVYVRSFADSDGDGVGDLRGVTERLDHLAWLGVDGLWLSPITVSPDDDWGYDVADYRDVHPVLGDLADLDALVAAARARRIRVLLDLVPNHTSDRHPWFLDARSGRGARHRDWYVWADPRPDGSPPNNWASVFGGPAWTLDEPSGQYYLHNFLPSQPDLNWWNEGVRAAFDDILRFWFDRGVAGFRIDVAHALVHDRELRDDPPAAAGEHPREYSMNRPEVHDVYRRWRRLAEGYDPPRLLLGETWVPEVERLADYHGRDDELQLAFNFFFVRAPFEAAALRAVVERTLAALPADASAVWTASNHDVGRFPTRWCGDDPRRTRCALLLLLALPGTAVLYYGDEMGMAEVPVAGEDVRDRAGHERDRGRTPMQWRGGPGAGFTDPATSPWLPFGEAAATNVADQRDDPSSTLSFCRDLVALRRGAGDLAGGAYRALAAPEGAWAWGRGRDHAVALNLSEREARIERLAGEILLATERARDGERVDGALVLGPREGAVVRAGA